MKIAGEREYEAQAGESLEYSLDDFKKIVKNAGASVPNNGRRTVRLFFEVTDG